MKKYMPMGAVPLQTLYQMGAVEVPFLVKNESPLNRSDFSAFSPQPLGNTGFQRSYCSPVFPSVPVFYGFKSPSLRH